MKVEFVLEGKDYSENKNEFKKLLAKHGLKWKGTMEMPLWGNEKEGVRGFFERDREKDITLSATLRWEGKSRTKFLAEFRKWAGKFKPKKVAKASAKEKKERNIDAKRQVAEELEFWDSLHKPNVEALKQSGRPEAWIESDIESWKKQRREKEKELKMVYGIK